MCSTDVQIGDIKDDEKKQSETVGRFQVKKRQNDVKTIIVLMTIFSLLLTK
jgi:hypothetical protein